MAKAQITIRFNKLFREHWNNSGQPHGKTYQELENTVVSLVDQLGQFAKEHNLRAPRITVHEAESTGDVS